MIDAKTQLLLKKLYALYDRPGSPGEKQAAMQAIERINQRLPKEDQFLNNDDTISDEDLLN